MTFQPRDDPAIISIRVQIVVTTECVVRIFTGNLLHNCTIFIDQLIQAHGGDDIGPAIHVIAGKVGA
jgi:hypothetical protein